METLQKCGCSELKGSKRVCPQHQATHDLEFTVTVQHRELCADHIDGHCITRRKGEEWQTVAAFSYQSEGAEYAARIAKEGKLTARLTSYLCLPPKVWEYTHTPGEALGVTVRDVPRTDEAAA